MLLSDHEYCQTASTVRRKYHGRTNRNFASSTARSYLPDYFCRDLLAQLAVQLALHRLDDPVAQARHVLVAQAALLALIGQLEGQ